MKKKKGTRVVALLLVLALLGSLLISLAPTVFAAKTSAQTINIKTVEDFLELADNCTLDTWSQGKTVVLQEDLSLAEVEFEGIPTFGGVFDGNGHTISDWTMTRSMTPAGLFSILQESGVVKDLKVSGTVSMSADNSNTGGIVGENYGMVTGCTFTGSVSGGDKVGGIVGINASTGQVLSCSASGAVSGDKMTGGIAGCSLGTIKGCENNAEVNTVSVDPAIRPEEIDLDFSLDVSRLTSMDTTMVSSDTGGIAGYSSGTLSDCVNKAQIGYQHIGYNVGGVVGRSCGYIRACENNGDIFGRKDVGGIAGQMEPDIAQNVTESTLSKLESQLDTLDTMLNKALDDGSAGVGAVTSGLNKVADYMDRAADAAGDIKLSGGLTSSVTGSGETGSSGSVTITPPQVEISGGIQGGLTESGAAGETSTSGSGSLDASTQLNVTTSLSGLTSAVSGMSEQMRVLNNSLSGTSGTLTGDMKTIQKQISAISDTVMELIQGDAAGDVLVDSSESNIDAVTLGKALDCRNRGDVAGDINVGGMTGAMAMEYELDPEDDLGSSLDGVQRKQMEIKAIIQNCVNQGDIVAKRNYAGGVCGRMDLGLITTSEGYGSVTSENGNYVGGIAGLTASTVRQCYAKCALSGEKYIGGIVGSGVAEDLSGSASTVTGCYSIVSIESCQAFAGAISGVEAGRYSGNYFVSDTLAGIDRRSYSGQAEPIAYADLRKKAESGDSIPKAFLQLTVTFVAEGETVKSVPFEYGATLDESVYPEIPAKEGYYVQWDKTELNNLHIDTEVTAVYTPYVSALSNKDTRENGRPIFFVEGQFDEDAAETNYAPKGFSVRQTERSASGTVAGHEVIEQWSLSIPDDGQKTHTVRYLAPSEDPDSLEIYVRQGSGWKKAETEPIGSYLTFSVDGTEAEIAAVETANTGWVGIVILALLLTALVLLFWLIRRRIAARRRQKLLEADEAWQEPTVAPVIAPEDEETGGMEMAEPQPKKKKRKVKLLLIVLAVILVLAGAAYFLLPGLMDGVQAYELLQTYSEAQELSMDLTVNARLGGEDLGFTARVDRTEVDGHRVTAISQEGMALYYSDGVVFLENGKAYRLSDSFPDYSQLLGQAIALYQHVSIRQEDGVYTITAEEEDARAILELLIPSAAGLLEDTNAIQVELLTEEGEVSALRFSGSGTLGKEDRTPFDLSAELNLKPETRDPVTIPASVKSAISSGNYEAEEVLTDNLIRLVNAWKALYEADSFGAELLLEADCGPVTLNDSFDYYRWSCDGAPVSSLQKNGYAVYFTDTAICDENGHALTFSEASGVEAAKLLDIAWQACMNGDLACSTANENDVYTLSLDEAGIQAVAYAIAPETQNMDLFLDSGSIQLVVGQDSLQSIELRCRGSVQVLFSSVDASFEARLEFMEGEAPVMIPEAVKEAL